MNVFLTLNDFITRLSKCISGLEESTGNLSINAGVRQQNSIAELLNKNIGVSDFALRIKTPKDICSPERWIENEIVNGSKQGAQLKKTEKKFTFMLGAGFSRTGDSIDSRLKEECDNLERHSRRWNRQRTSTVAGPDPVDEVQRGVADRGPDASTSRRFCESERDDGAAVCEQECAGHESGRGSHHWL